MKFTKLGGQNIKVDRSNESLVSILNQNNKIYSTISSVQNVENTTTHDESVFKSSKLTRIAKSRMNREVSNDIQICNTRHASSLVEKPSFGSILSPLQII